ncbi:ribosome maturation factor RimM [Glaciecola petra]|uniref:Ribosome maturation factor RimM n=1 Tax=Glaciecola petra TaxID=3075602 RepID=A0ABU2ZR25_9ALTE|nr:ribosome maturation factor RimM [Aestuariibacter sp. P117]MDT0594701.1 ribosome maturation factor RimM [Aestuariibacter sp. P117]
MSLASDKLTIGKIGAPYGVKGWVKINSFTQAKDNIFEYSPWQLNSIHGDAKNIKVDQWRTHNNSLVAKLEGIESRDDAEEIKNAEISIDASLLPELDNDFYWKDLIGMQVLTDKGYDMGVVKELFETGANDVMLVKAKINDAFGQKERLLPFLHDSVVLNVDKDGNTITVDWDPAF